MYKITEPLVLPREQENQITEEGTHIKVKGWGGIGRNTVDESGESGCLVFFPSVSIEDLATTEGEEDEDEDEDDVTID